MPLSYSSLVDAVESDLRDSSNTYHATAEIDYKIVEALRKVAEYDKHLIRVTYQIESRYGTATSTSSGNLVDATKDQFEAADVGKRLYNTTDETWADIISYSSAEQVGLSQDIMASGENYEIFNKGCWNNKQINIEDVEDYLWVERVDYPVTSIRSVERTVDFINGDILQIGLDREPDDSNPSNPGRVIDVHVYFAKRHKLSQMTDFTGAVDSGDSGYSKGDVSMTVDALESSGTIEEDQEFTLASRPQVYTVRADATIGTNEATVTFYPGLDADVAEDIVVNFKDSTLDRQVESLLIEYVVSKSLMDEANLHLPQISSGGTGTYKRYLDTASFRYREVVRQLEGLVVSKPAKILPRT